MPSPLSVGAVLLVAALFYQRYSRALKRVSSHVGFRSIISPMSLLGPVFPTIPGLYPGFEFPWRRKHQVFAEFGSDVISCVSVLDGRSLLYIADADLITKINFDRKVFPKPVEDYAVLGFLGDNLVIAEGHSHRRQCRIATPAFSSSMYGFLWTETRRIVHDMVETEGWNNLQEQEEIKVPHVVDLTLRLALMAIASAGFGMEMTWAEQPTSFDEDPVGTVLPPGHRMSMQTALHLVAKYSTAKLAVPNWATYLPIKALRTMRIAFEELELYIQEMIKEGKAELGVELEDQEQAQLQPTPAPASVEVIVDEVADEVVDNDSNDDAVTSSPSLAPSDVDVDADSGYGSGPSSPESKSNPLPLPDSTSTSTSTSTSVPSIPTSVTPSTSAPTLITTPPTPSPSTPTKTKGERSDLFHNLIRASVMDREEGGLSDSELIGNIYIFLLAGHETTAHSLAFTLALLALHPEEQDRLYEHVESVMPEDGETTIDDYKKFDRVRAVYFETLRMFPPIQQIPRIVAEDTAFIFDESNKDNEKRGLEDQEARETRWPTSSSSSSSTTTTTTPPTTPLTPRFSSSSSSSSKSFFKTLSSPGYTTDAARPGQKQLVVEKDTIIFIDPPAVHYNPKYYPDPYAFKPDRFMGDFNKNAFLPFSTGSRACLGRHFSEVESVCMLAHLIHDYSFHIDTLPGETLEQTKERLFKAFVAITLSPKNMPITFKRRIKTNKSTPVTTTV